MTSQANETIFSNWASYINKEMEMIIADNLSNKTYDPLVSQDQINTISQQIVEKLTNANKNFKYIVNVALVAKSSSGLDMGGLSYWDPDMDGSTFVKWDNKYLSCIANVYGIAN